MVSAAETRDVHQRHPARLAELLSRRPTWSAEHTSRLPKT